MTRTEAGGMFDNGYFDNSKSEKRQVGLVFEKKSLGRERERENLKSKVKQNINRT